MKNILKKTVCVMMSAILLISCNSKAKSTDTASIVSSDITVSLIDTVKADIIKGNYIYFLKNVLQATDEKVKEETDKIKYDVAFSKMQYKVTDPFAGEKVLSGLVAYPIIPKEENDKKLTIVSLQHGTLLNESDAPSLYTFEDPSAVRDLLCFVTPSLANGYVVLLPDYFGYGADQNGLHAYETRASLATATRGMIEAMPAFGMQRSIQIDTDKLFLGGYSEGGFATMSTLRSFSENPSTFTNIVTVAGAGAYDKLETATRIVQQKTGDSQLFTASYLWVMFTYNRIYNINRSLGQLVLPKYESNVTKYNDTDSVMRIQDIPSIPANIFSTQFVKGIVDRTDKEFIDALNDNNVSDFDARGTVYLIHGDADTWVPTFNTDSAYVRLQKRGVDVTKTIVPGGTHSSASRPFAKMVLEKLN